MGNQNNLILLLPYAVNLRRERNREREGGRGREGGRERQGEGWREGRSEKGVDVVRNTISHCLHYE